jgi:hypothetical protein
VAIDEQKIDDTVLALLRLTLHDGRRAWKSFDWNSLSRLHESGMIADPVNKAKSVVLTEKGLAESERLFEALFVKSGPEIAPDFDARDLARKRKLP